MDLFGDLPEPNADNKEAEVQEKTETSISEKKGKDSLFDDLPAESAPTCAAEVAKVSNGSKVDDPEARGQKRKAEEDACQAQKIAAKGPSVTEGNEGSSRPEPSLDEDGLRPVTPPPTGTPTVENEGESSGSTDSDRTPNTATTEKRTKPPTRNGKRKKSKLDSSLEAFATVFADGCNKDDRRLHLELQAQQHAHEMAMLRQILSVFSQQQRTPATPSPPPPGYQQQQWQPPHGAWSTPSPPSKEQQQWRAQEQPRQSTQGVQIGAVPTMPDHADRIVQHGELLFYDI